MRIILTLVVSMMLTACSALDLIPSPGVNANAQIGQENTQQAVGSQVTTTNEVQGNQQNTRDMVEVAQGGVTINNSPIWLIVIAILGWVLPTPLTMLKAVWYWLPFTKKPKE